MRMMSRVRKRRRESCDQLNQVADCTSREHANLFSVLRVSESTDQLPTDVAALQALLVATRAQRDAVMAERDHLLSQYDRLQHLLRQLQRAQFGRSSEKLDPDQLALAFEDIEQAVAAIEADDDKKDPVGA